MGARTVREQPAAKLHGARRVGGSLVSLCNTHARDSYRRRKRTAREATAACHCVPRPERQSTPRPTATCPTGSPREARFQQSSRGAPLHARAGRLPLQSTRQRRPTATASNPPAPPGNAQRTLPQARTARCALCPAHRSAGSSIIMRPSHLSLLRVPAKRPGPAAYGRSAYGSRVLRDGGTQGSASYGIVHKRNRAPVCME